MIGDDCYFLDVLFKDYVQCKICLTLELFANSFYLKSLSLSLKIHMNVPYSWLICGLQVYCLI